MVSDAQLKANQENAKLGGVKTPEGKAVSKYNAVSHGILKDSITEYEAEFASNILEVLKRDYQPVGTIEEILLERIALYYLKLFRIQKAETEYIKSQLNPKVVKNEGGSFQLDKLGNDMFGKTIVVNEGYGPKLTDGNMVRLSEVYSRYEGTIENRLFRALHELERSQRLRKGEKILAPITADINEMGSFGERGGNDE